MASNWKCQYSSHLHLIAHTALNTLVQQQETMLHVLNTLPVVGDLAFLRELLELLGHIDDLHHSIDDQYLPVEEMYSQLRYMCKMYTCMSIIVLSYRGYILGEIDNFVLIKMIYESTT